MKKTLAQLLKDLENEGIRTYINTDETMVTLGMPKGQDVLGQQQYDMIDITKDTDLSDQRLIAIQSLLK